MLIQEYLLLYDYKHTAFSEINAMSAFHETVPTYSSILMTTYETKGNKKLIKSFFVTVQSLYTVFTTSNTVKSCKYTE